PDLASRLFPYTTLFRSYETISPLGGSFHSQNIKDYYLTPHELDYGRIIAFDHDYIGRQALETMPAEGSRKKVTLVWNGDDVGKRSEEHTSELQSRFDLV